MPSILLYILGVFFFALFLLVSIGLHELGHLYFAKKFGTRVPEYAIGFGPRLLKIKGKETLYSIRLIPLGGFIKIVGMFPPAKDDPSKIRKSNTGLFSQIVSDARATTYEEVVPEDEDRLFYKLPWWKKAIIMFAGPAVNLVLAFVIFLLIFSTFGERTFGYDKVNAQISGVTKCVIPPTETRTDCRAGDFVPPAAKAGLKEGDIFLSVNGVKVKGWLNFKHEIEKTAGGPVTLEVKRGEKTFTVKTETIETLQTLADGSQVKQGYFGVLPTLAETSQKGGPIFTLKSMGRMTKETGITMVHLPPKVYNVLLAIFGQEQRDPEGPVSVVGGARFSGEIAATTDIPILTTERKIIMLFSIVAGFNLFIGLLNLLPLLPLDGGHIAGALYEGLRNRLRRKKERHYVDTAKMLPVAFVMSYALLMMGVILIVGDFVVPLSIK